MEEKRYKSLPHSRSIMLILMVQLIVSMALIPCRAETEVLSTVKIPVKQVVDKSSGDQEVVSRYILEGIDGAPMPEEGGEVIELRGNTEGNFGEIKYVTPELYQYKIRREPISQGDYTVDEGSYDIVIAALSDGTVRTISQKENVEGKSMDIMFHDVAPEEPEQEEPEDDPLIPDTGDVGGGMYLLLAIFSLASISFLYISDRCRMNRGDTYRK